MSGNHFAESDRDEQIRHAKSDAPTEREFEQLMEASYNLDAPRDLEARFVLVCGGRLGMRPGEIAHFRSDWIDWHESRLEIPAHEPCRKGRDDGPCHDCQTRAEQRTEHNEDLSYEEALRLRWHPKTENGIREIPFDWSERVRLVLEQFTDLVDGYPNSRNVVNRRVSDLAQEAGMDVDGLYPHALRAASATYHAGRGVDALNLMSLHGWEMLATAQLYLQESSANTQRALRAAHSR
jgi:integrase